MKLLLDTHVLVWFATNRRKLKRREREALVDPSATLLLSTISLWELRAKTRAERRHGTRGLYLDPAGAIDFCIEADVAIEEMTLDDLLAAQLIPEPPHGDPVDEMLLVHARRLDAKLLTRDDKLLGHPLAY